MVEEALVQPIPHSLHGRELAAEQCFSDGVLVRVGHPLHVRGAEDEVVLVHERREVSPTGMNLFLLAKQAVAVFDDRRGRSLRAFRDDDFERNVHPWRSRIDDGHLVLIEKQ